MDKLVVSFKHCGKKVTLRALIKYDGAFHPVLTKHECNDTVEIETIDYLHFSMFFTCSGSYSYEVCGYIGSMSVKLVYIRPFNNYTERYECDIYAEEFIDRLNW